jgi:hypothetical protein
MIFWADYQEARNSIWGLPAYDPTHGTPLRRLTSFDYGLNQNNWGHLRERVHVQLDDHARARARRARRIPGPSPLRDRAPGSAQMR